MGVYIEGAKQPNEVKDDTSKLREEMEKNDRRTRHDIYLLLREQRELERSIIAEKKFVRTCISIFAGAIVGVFMLCLLIGRQPESHSAIVTNKFERDGAYFIECVVPVDSDTYVGLDIGDECFVEED